VGFFYLSRFPALEALSHFSEALRRFAAAKGKPHLYHETITWAFIFLIRERVSRFVQQSGRHPTWDEFAAENPDLLVWKESVLRQYYCEETLASDFARKTFVLPNKNLPPY
jgi:hypothetical protein